MGIVNSYITQRGSAMAEVVSCQPVTTETLVKFQARPCGICSGQNGTGTGFPPNTSVFPSQHHSISTPYSFIHMSLTLYNLCS